MANKNLKLFNAGTLQSIIDNTSITFDYDFQGTPSTQWVDVNPVPFFYHGDEDTSYAAATGTAAQNPPVGNGVNQVPADNTKNWLNSISKTGTAPPTTNTNSGSGGGVSDGQSGESGGPHAAEIEALKQYEHCWGTTGSPICSQHKV